MIKSIHVSINELEETKRILAHLARFDLAEKINSPEIGIIYHLQGLVHKAEGEHQLACQDFEQSLAHTHTIDLNYLFMLENLTSLHRETNDNRYLDSLKQLLDAAQSIDNLEHVVIANFHILSSTKGLATAVDFIEDNNHLEALQMNLESREYIIETIITYYTSLESDLALYYKSLRGTQII